MLGGPGLVFLYARRDLLPSLEPAITGWFAQREPFSFDAEHLDYHPTARRLEHGTPPAPVFFIAQGGIDIISEVGPAAIRVRNGELSDHVIARADGAGLEVRTPRDRDARGGVVNVKVGPEAEKIATSSWHGTSARTTAATVCGSARTSSTPRRTSTAASTSSGGSSDRQRTTTGTRWGTLFMKPP